jgi:hypothetical protein
LPTNHADDSDVPIGPIADLVDGAWVKVVGKVVRCEGDALVAPITGRACACFDAAVWSWTDRSPDGFVAWTPSRRLVARSLRGTPFVLEDESGQAVVDPRGAFVRLTLDHERGPQPDPLAWRSIADPSLLADVPLTPGLECAEGVLAIGETVLVSGLVHAGPLDGASTYRASADRRVRIAGSATRPASVTERGQSSAAVRTRQHVSGRTIIVPDD